MRSRSFTAAALVVVCVGGRWRGVEGRALEARMPVVTPAPSVKEYEEAVKRQDDGPDAISLAQILLTAIPESLRQIAATNVPAVSSILNDEFSDDNRPEWFNELPYDIQAYLIEKFGPATAMPEEPSATEPAWSEPTENTWWTQPTENTWWTQPSATSQASSTDASSSASESTQTSDESQTPSASATSSEASNSASTTSLEASDSASATGSRSPGSSSTQVAAPTKSDSPTDSSPPAPTADEADDNRGLTKSQKIGLGVGIPFAIIGAAALLFGCCFLLRRRQRKRVDGSIPPSSPGFIPRFAFQEKNADPEHRQPLNRASSTSFADLANMDWDDEVADYVDTSSSGESIPTLNNPPPSKPVMAPALYHTHSSNRARGKRTSYTSLHSVAEVTEPDDNPEMESPVLGRHTSPKTSPHRPTPPKRQSPPSPRALIPPPMPAAAQIKRKPVPTSPVSPTSPTNSAFNPTAALASHSLLRQTMPDHSSRSRSVPTPSRFGNHTQVSSNARAQPQPYVSPIEERSTRNPFSNDYSYEEDYGPEYFTQHNQRRASNDSYIDVDDGLYGHRSLSRYPDPRTSQKSKTDWPLKNFPGHKRNRSPMWDRVYDGSNG